MTNNLDEMRYAMAEQRSFTGSAVLVFFLYWLFWLPGLITNIVYLREARSIQRQIGRPPAGMGCLWALLVLALLPIVLFCLWFIPGFMYATLRGVS